MGHNKHLFVTVIYSNITEYMTAINYAKLRRKRQTTGDFYRSSWARILYSGTVKISIYIYEHTKHSEK